MRIAFHAPMKPPDHPEPSGDRRMAGLLMAALSAAGHNIELASRFRSYDALGDPVAQLRDRREGHRLAMDFVARPGPPPDLWFTYHLYHRAPDWVGPHVARRMKIPYVVAEASHAPKRASGTWRVGHGGAAAAIRRADRIISLTPRDEPCVRALRSGDTGMVRLAPFIDPPPIPDRERARRDWAARLGVDPDQPWLLTVAMMRDGAKLASYRVLGESLARLGHREWQAIIIGDGPARAAAETVLPTSDRVHLIGCRPPADITELAAAADLFAWPAVREGYGMALLEAQAMGLPVVAGRTPGVETIVADGESGILTPPGDAGALAEAVGALLNDPVQWRTLSDGARRKTARDHGIAAAARRLDEILTSIGQARAA